MEDARPGTALAAAEAIEPLFDEIGRSCSDEEVDARIAACRRAAIRLLASVHAEVSDPNVPTRFSEAMVRMNAAVADRMGRQATDRGVA